MVPTCDGVPNQVGKRTVTHFTNAVVHEVSLAQVIQQHLLLDRRFRDELVDWGDLPRSPAGTYANIQDGWVARQHPELGRPRHPDEPARLAFATYADDVEVVNPIGAARVKHKVTLHYATILNQRAHIRSQLDNIYLVAVVLSKEQAAVGPARVLDDVTHQDVDDEGCQSTSSVATFAETMRQFARPNGISFTIPCWNGSGSEIVHFRGFLLVVCADTLAAAELIGFKRGFNPSVFRPCWQCYCKGATFTDCILTNPHQSKPCVVCNCKQALS